MGSRRLCMAACKLLAQTEVKGCRVSLLEGCREHQWERQVWKLPVLGLDFGDAGKRAKYHSRAWKDVPTESKPISILNFTPLLFQSFVIHSCGVPLMFRRGQFVPVYRYLIGMGKPKSTSPRRGSKRVSSRKNCPELWRAGCETFGLVV